MEWEKYLKDALRAIYKKDGYNKQAQDNLLKQNEDTLRSLERRLNHQIYKFGIWKPMVKNEIKNGKPKERVIIKPDFFDKIILKSVCEYIRPILEPHFKLVDKNSFAYQKGKSIRDALLRIKESYRPGNVILKLDIKSFFDNINPDKVIALLENLDLKLDKYVIYLIQESLSPTLEINEYYERSCASLINGIPQGNPVSSVLSNLYLLELDWKYASNNIKMVRYADDIVFILEDKEQAELIYNEVKEYLKERRGLDVHPVGGNNEKTVLYDDLLSQPLLYLGMKFDGSKILPTEEKFKKLENTINSIIYDSDIKKEIRDELIDEKINQWCGYFSFSDVEKETLDILSRKINEIGKKTIGSCEWENINIWESFHFYKANKRRLDFGEKYDWLKY